MKIPKQCLRCGKIFVRRDKIGKFCSLTCASRYNLNNKNASVTLPACPSTELAELFGILLGDGSVEKYYVKIVLNRIADKDYAPKVFYLCKKLFSGATISMIDRPKRGTLDIQISSKDVSDFILKAGFKAKNRHVPDWIQNNDLFGKATIRGLVDTEGSVSLKHFAGKRGNYAYAQIAFTNKSKGLLSFVENKLYRFGFKPTRNSTKNIYISNTRDIDRYMVEIGSSNPKFSTKLRRRVAEKRRGGRVV